MFETYETELLMSANTLDSERTYILNEMEQAK